MIYIDIETLPTSDQDVIADLTRDISPPGNMSKADTIAAWEIEKKPALVEAAMRKTALDGTYGRILAIGMAFNDEPPAVIIDENEPFVLRGTFQKIEDYGTVNHRGHPTSHSQVFCGHNVSGFDLRFLWQRAVINGIPMPKALREAVKAKPWAESIADTMVMWSPDRERRISLDKLCRALGVASPKAGGFDGSQVYDAYLAGELDKIAAYCGDDIVAVRSCYLKMIAV